jgi:ATP-dependent helicase/nuclease subunit B
VSLGAPRLYAIAPGIPLVDALARGLIARFGRPASDGPSPDPLALARATVLLPTRRAVRSLREAFLRATDGRPLLLPRMMPLGDLDEDELALAPDPATGSAPDGPAAGALPPVIGGLRRQLLLARLVLRFGGARWEAADPGQAVELAAELARLLDQMETERIGFEELAALTPAEESLARHWGEVLAFLKIVSEHWPGVLAEEGAIGPATRRDRLLAAQAASWAENPPDGWVIAAGSTGSIPAAADLLATVAGLERGCVLLPGLDRDLDDAIWAQLPETHAQFGLSRLLKHVGAPRRDVRDWHHDWLPDETVTAPGAASSRARLMSIAMSPVPTATREDTAKVTAKDTAEDAAALEDVTWIESPSPAEEAAAIALVMRETLEHTGRTAALVTPDRGLARRVAARLNRWGVEVDDSAGTPLAATPLTIFLRLVAQMAASRLGAVALLACLKHPLAAGGMARAPFLAHVRDLDRLVLRGPAPVPGIDALKARINVAHERAMGRGNNDTAERIKELGPWLDGWVALLGPFAAMMAKGAHAPADLLAAHVAAAEALAATDLASGADALWRGEEAESLAGFIADVATASGGFPNITGARYPGLIDGLLAGRVVRPRFGRHPRLNIWGPLEARLQHADVMILGGLNEGTWPLDPGNDPWMSRPMRARLGLPLPERRIGLAAHDFAQGFCAAQVVLTRAHRVGGTPTVPSRWLLRLANAIGDTAANDLKSRGAHWLTLAEASERTRPRIEGKRPAPVPPLELRPRQLSVTEIETWQVNPYAIYARHVLKLAPLDDIGAEPGAAERGSFIHDVMEKLLVRFPKGVPAGGSEEIYQAMIEIGAEALGPVGIAPGLRAIWWPRFLDIARWAADQEMSRRAGAQPLAAEKSGRLKFALAGGNFHLIGRADRIDRLPDGSLAIVDYKTGQLPTARDQLVGFAPQLPLLAVMAEQGAFDGIAPNEVSALSFWRLMGGDKGGEERNFAVKDGLTLAEVIEDTKRGLIALVDMFDQKKMPYTAHTAPGRVRFDDYRHLARVSEWSADGGAEDA